MARLEEINVKYWRLAHSASDLAQPTPQDFACRCDICGDSTHSRSKKRLHLFTKHGFDGDAVRCFNCDYTGNMWTYLRDYHPGLFNTFKQEKASESFDQLVMVDTKKDEAKKESQDMPGIVSMDFGTVPEALKKPEEPEITQEPRPPKLVAPLVLEKLSRFPDAVQYLRNRGIEPPEYWLYSNGKMRFDDRDFNLWDYIIIPLKWSDGRWYGLQALAWKKKDFRVILLKENMGWKVENWCSIKKDEPVFIFESVYDRLSSGIENSLAQMGAQLSDERLKELKTPIFCLDNTNIDNTAKKQSLKYAEKGYKVFLWPKGSEKFKDTNDLRKINVPYDKIQNMINNNIYEGMEAVLKITMEY